MEYPNPKDYYTPRGILGGDNFNRVIKTQSWGKETRVDVFHMMCVIQGVRAPPSLSRTEPEIPLNKLTGTLNNIVRILALVFLKN